ncbi:hypothetical protein GQ457_04G020230 [Hibiscus cannabinus]
MLKRYCWKLFVLFRFYARNDQPGRIKSQQYCEVVLKQLISQRPRNHQGKIIFFNIPNEVCIKEAEIKSKSKNLKPKRIKDYLEYTISQRNAIPRSESAKKICPGRTRCLLLRHPLCHPVQADYRSP